MNYATVVGIDPGPTECAAVEMFGGSVSILREPYEGLACLSPVLVAYEQFAAMGQSVADESYRTIWNCRGFVDRLVVAIVKGGGTADVVGVTRRQVKSYLVGTQACGDPQVRDAIICRYGGTKAAAIGRKGNPGPLFGIVSHHWAAMAVAITAADPVQLEIARGRSWA